MSILRKAFSLVGVSGLLLSVVLGRAQAPVPYGPPELLATVDTKDIDEASGIADSRRNPGIVWVHNDSGDGPFVYGIDVKGSHRGTVKAYFRVRDAEATDWEDMAIGPGPGGKGVFLYLGDIGDNHRQREFVTVYRIAEPQVPADSGSKKKPHPTVGPTVRRDVIYPDGAHNAEALLCHPKTGTLYLVTKEESGISIVYRFPPESATGGKGRLIPVGQIVIPEENHAFPRLVTGGEISPDGTRVVLQTYDAAYELRLPSGSASFDTIWRRKLTRIETVVMPQAEAVCFTRDGKALLETSEKRPTPIYRLKANL